MELCEVLSLPHLGALQGSWGCFPRIWYVSSKLRLDSPLGLLAFPQIETSTKEGLSKGHLWLASLLSPRGWDTVASGCHSQHPWESGALDK